jgi:hypothetical protein
MFQVLPKSMPKSVLIFQTMEEEAILADYDYFGMIFTVIMCHPVSWRQTVNTQHYTSRL